MDLRLRLLSLCLAASSLGLPRISAAQEVLAKDSPFLPPGAGSGAASDPDSAGYELDGASVTSQGTSICIYDVKEKHSRWIGVGNSDGRIQVVRYDPNLDRAEIRVDGESQILELRKAAEQPVSGNLQALPLALAPMSPNGIAPDNHGTSPENLRKQREARMMVTDLMMIGMRQRMAHDEEVRKKAEEEGH